MRMLKLIPAGTKIPFMDWRKTAMMQSGVLRR